MLTAVKILALGLYEAFVYRPLVTVVQFLSQFRVKKTARVWASPRRVQINA